MNIQLNQKAMIVNRNNQFLVLKDSEKNMWDLPGGLVRIPESNLDAISRAIQEQTSLSIDNLHVIELSTFHDAVKDAYVIFAGYKAVYDGPEELTLQTGFTDAGWFAVDTFLTLDVPLYVHEFVEKAATTILL